MAQADVEADFRRFVATGDPAALGVVFDSLAGDLLLVAAHVARNGTEAEDLVQGTFLAAIEAKDRYDAARPLRPWLIGILVNQARSARRRAGRAADPRLLQRATSVDPAVELEVRDLVETVAAAIETMPPHYRQVLHLRLVHDFELGQIARALGIPEGTVKSRLVRGTELLRGALPAGVAVSTAIAVGTGRLAAMRATVLGAVPAKVVTASAASSAKLVGALSAGLLLTALVAFAGFRTWATPASVATAVAPQATPPDVLPANPADPIGANDRQPVAAAEGPTGDAAAPRSGVVVRGRLVALETGATIEGTAAVLPRTSFANLTVLAFQGVGQTSRPPGSSTTAGLDGRFELRLEVVPGAAWQLAVAAPDRVPTFLPLGMVAAEQDVGDIALGAGTLVTFAVVEEAQQPVAGARFELAPPGKWDVFAGEALGVEVRRAVSSAAGRFELRLAPGVVELQSADDHRLVEPAEVTVASGPQQHVTVRIQQCVPQARVRGVVQDPNGVPIAGIEVGEFGSRKRSITDANGRFECDVVHGTGGRVCVLAESRSGDYEEAWSQTPLPGNGEDGEDIVIVLRRPQELRLQVVRAATGEPVERFAVLDFGVAFPTARAATHAGGLVTLPRSEGATREFVVIPSEGGLAATSILEVAADGALLHRVALRAAVAMPVRVVDPQGRPVAGTTVELLDPMGRDLSGFEQAVFLEDLTSTSLWNQVLALDEATTDADGRAVLHGGSGAAGLLLRARGAGHAPALVRGVECGPREQRIEVAPGACVRGRIGSPAAARRLEREFGTKQPMFGARNAPKAPLGVFATSSGVRLPADDRTWPLSADGEFEATGVPPGAWQIHLWVPTSLLGDFPGAHTRGWSRHLGTVQVAAAGATYELDTEIHGRFFGELRARVTFDGAPWANRDCHLRLRGEDHDVHGWWTKVRTDAEGRFTRRDLLVGEYSVILQFDPKIEGRHGNVELPQRIEIAAGSAAEVQLAGWRRRARVRLLDGAGAPVARRSCALRQGRVTYGMIDATTDDQGWLLVDPVPYGPFTLVAAPDEFDLDLPEHQTAAEWVLRVK